MRETALNRVWGRFWGPIWRISDQVGKCAKIVQKLGLENMELDGFGVVVAPFGLGLAVVRATGPKFHYRPLFGHMGPPGAQNGPFSGFWVTSGFWPVPGLLSLGPLGPIGPCLGSYAGVILVRSGTELELGAL